MKIYKNERTKKAWLNAGYISTGEKTNGKRATKRFVLDYDSISDITDWVESDRKTDKGNIFYVNVDVPITLEEITKDITIPAVYDNNGNVLIEPLVKKSTEKVYRLNWNIREE